MREEVFTSKAKAAFKFKARKGDAVDQELAKVIKTLDATIPIKHIKGQLYLIGSQRCTLTQKRDHLLVRTGGGYTRLETFLNENNGMF